MRKIIPRELIKHLEWNPTNPPKEEPKSSPKKSSPVPSMIGTFSIEQMLNGKTFYNTDRNASGNLIGVAVSLRQALKYATSKGIVLTMPELIKAKTQADKSHEYWRNWLSAYTEENIGIDRNGKFGERNEPVLVVVHGGGILTPDRIMKAYEDGLIGNSAKYTEEEFNELLEGRVNGNEIPFYALEEIKRGVPNLPHRFGVVMPYRDAQATSSGFQNKSNFLNNPLVIARNGGLENLETYFDMAKDNDKIGCWHSFSGRDTSIPQGRLLFLNAGSYGLSGINYLDNYGRFVGVAPEALRAKK